jgi:hypothetical protein
LSQDRLNAIGQRAPYCTAGASLGPPGFTEQSEGILTWHAGQIYGFDEKYAKARERFVGSLNPKEPSDSMVLWNDYAFASIAFLDRDLETLQAHRNRIARGPDFNGKKANLAVVDHLIQFFDKPYGFAYSGGNTPPSPRKCQVK